MKDDVRYGISFNLMSHFPKELGFLFHCTIGGRGYVCSGSGSSSGSSSVSSSASSSISTSSSGVFCTCNFGTD